MLPSRFRRGATDPDLRFGQVAKHVVSRLYDPCWFTLSAWLGATNKSDALNGAMHTATAEDGVPELSAEDSQTIHSILSALKVLTGPEKAPKSRRRKQDQPKVVTASSIADKLRKKWKQYPDKQALITPVVSWWSSWRHLNHVDVRKEWSSPLSTTAIDRMVLSCHRTRSIPKIWEQIVARPEFYHILSAFHNVPSHREVEEQELGWEIHLPLNSNEIDEMRLPILKSPSSELERHRSLCRLGYDPLEPKIKGRRKGGQQKLVTSVALVSFSSAELATDPFKLGVTVAPHSMFHGYLATHFLARHMWPKHTEWPNLYEAMVAWQIQDVEAVDVLASKSPGLLESSQAVHLWDSALRGWENLAVRLSSLSSTFTLYNR